MLGVVIGVVSAVVIFAFFPHDKQAVKKYQQEKKQQTEKKLKQKQERQAKIKQQQQKIANDPELKKKRQQREEKMKKKLFEGLSDKDKQLLEEYMDDKRKSGKSDAQIIKDATNKAGLFLFGSLILVILLALAIMVIMGGQVDLGKIETELRKALSYVFPKFGESIQGTQL